jgi:hypothetical protein
MIVYCDAMKKITVRNLLLDDAPLVESWLFERFKKQGRYAERSFKHDVVSGFINASITVPKQMLSIGAFYGSDVVGVFCGGISEHPFFDCKVAANIAYQAEGSAGALLIDRFTEWAIDNGAQEILIGTSAHPQKHEAYKRLMRKQGYFDSDLTFFKVV